MKSNEVLNVLLVTASARDEGSVSRQFAGAFLDELGQQLSLEVRHRDVARGLPFVDANWLEANFTPSEQRTERHQQTLAQSDALVDELIHADMLLIASPIYNFSVPASLKAWIDMVARVGRTFRYTSEGPVGLLAGKKAIAVVASGGTAIGSDIDFASGYLRHIMGFVGIHDFALINAERYNADNAEQHQSIQQQISEQVRKVA